MAVDDITKAWIRNRSDELAVENGCKFDIDRANHACDWIERYCRLYEGTKGPMVLGDWQREASMRMFGWVKWSDRLKRWIRRFTRASMWVPKKNAKSPTAAAWALYLLAGDGEPGNHVFFCAADGTQARIVAKHACEMVRASPELDEEQGGCIGINRSEMKLMHRPSLSDAKPISSGDNRAARAKQGLNGSVIIDEVHVVTAEFISESSIDMAGISRDEPMHIEVSTAGKDPDSYGKKQYDYGKLIEKGELVNERFFFLCHEAPQDLTDEELDKDPLKWGRMANPTMGRIVQEEEFLATYQEKKKSLADLADFKTFRLNIWQTTATPWIRMDDWRRCEQRFSERDCADRECCAGFDLAITRDMSSLVFVFPWEDETFRILPYFFMCEKNARELAVRVPQMLEWMSGTGERRYLHVTQGSTTDFNYIRRFFLERSRLFRIQSIVYDERFAENVTQEMENDTGVERLKFVQRGGKFNEPTQNFERAVIEGKMHHNGNPILTWQFGHVNVSSDRFGNMMPVKPEKEDHKKIDGVIASVMGFAAARLLEAAGEKYVPGTLLDRD